MGTDIHFYVERFEAGRWVSCDTWEPDEYWDKERGGAAPLTVPYGKHFYDSRNYDLFAMLANVRNGRGFAGTDTGDGFNYIAEPRGLPDDLSPKLAREAEHCDHTPSWLLVSEIMAFDWTQVTVKRGVVNGPQYRDWTRWRRRRGLGPNEYCSGVSGRDVVHLTEDQMIGKVADCLEGITLYADEDAALKKLQYHYCMVAWETPYYREASEFLSETLPRLWRLGEPDKVRCVFWFDS